MQIKTFAPVEYENHKILIRCFKKHWEYLFVHKNEIYTLSFTVEPDLLHKVLYFFSRRLYSLEQERQAIIMVKSAAMTTINLLLEQEA